MKLPQPLVVTAGCVKVASPFLKPCTMKQYQCLICGFIYDEALGIPEEGIPAGTRWEDVPTHWECPDCGVTKSEFDMVAL